MMTWVMGIKCISAISLYLDMSTGAHHSQCVDITVCRYHSQ